MHFLKTYWKWIALAAGLIAMLVAVSFLPVGEWVKSFTNWIRHLGLAGAFIFIGVYGLAALLFLPGAIFTSGPFSGSAWHPRKSKRVVAPQLRVGRRRNFFRTNPPATLLRSGDEDAAPSGRFA